ncbi:MAG: hypothetical protein ABW170_12285 [Candidatus Thiodiazotropha sp. L084R]
MAAQTTTFGKMRRVCLRQPIIALCLFGSLAQVSIADDDAYLSEISIEAQKVDSELPTKEEATLNSEAGSDEDTARQAFEEDLKSRYMGSYTFYQKLPRRAREEVFEEYIGGASIDEIRKKIMNRFLNQ